MATVIIKPTEACNAHCAYCDVVHKRRPEVVTMSPQVLEQLFVRAREFLLERSDESLDMVWHGGEPLLLGPDFFTRAREFQQKHCRESSSRIRHFIQSNLTLFSRRFAEVFRQLGINQIGTSYDPIPGLRCLGKEGNSAAYNGRFMQGLQLAEEEGFGWGLIYVVTNYSLARPLDIFYFLTNLSPTGGVMFNPVLLYGEGARHLAITPGEFVEFLGAIFPVWWRHQERYPDVEPFRSLKINLVEGHRRLACGETGDCANSHFNLAPDGTFSQCGRSSDWGLLDYGSIFERSLTEILSDPQRKLLLHRNQVLSQGECKGCRFWSICHGGCPLDSWSEKGSFLHRSPWCQAKKDFIERYFEPISEVRFVPDTPADLVKSPSWSPSGYQEQ